MGLLSNGQGTTGQLFRRNRFFDPASGQFTQEDPIGIAGGMNLWGIAGGDPVNFSDPFGLCKDQDVNCKYLIRTLREHGGSAFTAAAERYDALKTGEVSFIAISQLSAWNQSLGVRGLTDTKTGDVWLVGEASRADFLVTSIHESLHLGGTAEDDPALVNGVYNAYMQLSPEERGSASFTKRWLRERGRLKDEKKKDDNNEQKSEL